MITPRIPFAKSGRPLLLLSFLLPPALLFTGGAPAQQPSAPASGATVANQAEFIHQIQPLIGKYCAPCHSGSNATAGLSLSSYKDLASVLKDRDTWVKVADRLQSGQMPPQGAPHPTTAQRDILVRWIQTTLSNNDCKLPDPGRVTLRRLNRVEYNNTVRDLLGVDFHPAEDFPSDDVGYGFDNIGDVLAISPLLMEKYLTAADKVARAAIVLPDADSRTVRFDPEKLTGTEGIGFTDAGARLISSEGNVGATYDFPRSGEYILNARAYGEQAGPDPCRMGFLLDGKLLHVADVPAVEESPGLYSLHIVAPVGKHRVAVSFTNDYYHPEAPAGQQDRNLVVESLEIVGPLGSQRPISEAQRRLFAAAPADAPQDVRARKIMQAFANRAFRRPATPLEVDWLTHIVEVTIHRGESFDRGIQLAVEAALVSPHFLFHVEVDPHPNDPRATRLLDSYEIASRLSYFLWSSMPDQELFNLAHEGALQKPAVLAAQVQRMLKDPKAHALTENFAGQWLQLRNLANVSPDPQRFPDFNDTLRTAMRTETEMFFDSIVREDRSVLDFLDGKFTYLNGPLARHYGIPGIQGAAFRRIALRGDERGGVLTQASILTVTSNPTRTSPVKRGKWVLENFLGTPPPPPPPDVPALNDAKGAELVGTMRQRMEQHRKNPACASCHARMDPIGFGLENYDAVGEWRTHEGKFPIDASGTLVDGHKFVGPAQLKEILLADKDQFTHCLASKLMTYALGRGMEPSDKCTLDSIVKTTASKHYRFSALVTAVVESSAFRERRGDGGLAA